MTQRGNDVSNICRFVPKLTVNGQFIRDFMAEESPCFALGLVEERKQPCGFLALRPAEVISPEISQWRSASEADWALALAQVTVIRFHPVSAGGGR